MRDRVPAGLEAEPADLHGSFASRTDRALMLLGAALPIGGIASIVRIVQQLASARASLGDIFDQMGVFLGEWETHLFAKFFPRTPGAQRLQGGIDVACGHGGDGLDRAARSLTARGGNAPDIMFQRVEIAW